MAVTADRKADRKEGVGEKEEEEEEKERYGGRKETKRKKKKDSRQMKPLAG